MKIGLLKKLIPFIIIFILIITEVSTLIFLKGFYLKKTSLPIISNYSYVNASLPTNLNLDILPASRKYLKLQLPNLSAKSILVENLNDNSILYDKRSNDKMYIASITKLITTATVLSNFQTDGVVRTDSSSVSIVDSYIKLPNNADFRISDLLYALLLPSSNQAAFTFANNMGYSNFISKMNAIAKSLELQNSFFINPAGFDDSIEQNGVKSTNLSSAQDVAVFTKYILSFPLVRDIVKTKNKTIYSFNNEAITLTNTNELLDNINGVIGVKTGSEVLAGQCLDLAYQKDGNTFLIVILNSSDRFGEALKIINAINLE